MIRVKIKPKIAHVVFEIIALLAAIAGSLIVLWIFETIIVIVLLFFGGKSIYNKMKPFYVSAPLREDMIKEQEDRKRIISEPTKRGLTNEDKEIQKNDE
ncbi:MAG: hypothetical protein ACTSQ6_06460 [Candidatus Heimdallarchaeaceae archaeon]